MSAATSHEAQWCAFAVEMVDQYPDSAGLLAKVLLFAKERLPTKETAMSPQEQEIRLECLKLAARDRVCGAEAVANADRYYVFLTTEKQTPRQTIDAALDKAGVA